MSPFRAVLCSFCLIFFALEFRGIYFGVLLLVLLYLFSFPFFFGHSMLFLRYDHFRVADRFVCSYFFLVVSCTFVISLVYGYICAACNTLCVSKKNLNTLWCSNGGRSIFEFMFPPHTIVHNYVLRDHQSLLLRLLGASASPCTYLNPS